MALLLELFIDISQFLPLEDIKRLSFLNRQFYEYINADSFWHILLKKVYPFWAAAKPTYVDAKEWYSFLSRQHPLDDPFGVKFNLTIEQAYQRKMNETGIKYFDWLFQDLHLALIYAVGNKNRFNDILKKIDWSSSKKLILADLINYFFWLDDNWYFHRFLKVVEELDLDSSSDECYSDEESYSDEEYSSDDDDDDDYCPHQLEELDNIYASHKLKEALPDKKDFQRLAEKLKIQASDLYTPFHNFIASLEDPFYAELLQNKDRVERFRRRLDIFPISLKSSLFSQLDEIDNYQPYDEFYKLFAEMEEKPMKREKYLEQILDLGLLYGAVDIILLALLEGDQVEEKVAKELLAEFQLNGYFTPSSLQEKLKLVGLDLAYLAD